MWQDYVTSAAGISFSYALIPQVIKGFKQKKQDISIQTAAITSIGLTTLSYTFYTLDLNYSCCINALSAGLWAIILGQSIKYRKKNQSLDGEDLDR